MNHKVTLKSLFLTFIRIGALTFGGGYVMIPMMQRRIVDDQGWISDDEMLDIITIAEATPGPLAINAATFIGYKLRGFFGALFATLAVVLPAFFIILLLSLFIVQAQENIWIANAFKGIRAGIAVLIFNAVFKLSKKVQKKPFEIVIMASVAIVALTTTINVILLLILAACLGIVYGFFSHRSNGGDQL